MTISVEEAAQAIDEIERVRVRARILHGYRGASIYLLSWGLLWLGADLLCDVAPANAGIYWIGADTIGILASLYIGSKLKQTPRIAGTRYLAAASIFALFITASLSILPPHDGRQVHSFISLVVAASYALAGTAIGLRFFVTGLALGVLTLVGHFAVSTHYYLWMGVMGGGALLLAGLWLRRA